MFRSRPSTWARWRSRTMPKIRQVLVVDADDAEPGTMERRLYLARKQFERAHERGDVTGYICSLSTQTIVYKAMCTGRILPHFYPDLASAELRDSVRGLSPALRDQHPSHLASRPARPHARAQRRDQYGVGKSRPHGGARFHAAGGVQACPDAGRNRFDQPGRGGRADLAKWPHAGRGDAHVAAAGCGIGTSPHRFCAITPTAPSPGTAGGDCFRDGSWSVPCSTATACGPAGLPSRTAASWWQDRRRVWSISIPNEVTHSGRLGPGQMLVVDLEKNKVYEDEELLELFDAGATYAKLVEDTPLVPVDVPSDGDAATLTALQKGFGYTREDVKMILQPMAAEGKDAVWSMGDDTPLAFLARTPRPVYAYFRQRFAQVTNPPIDPLRESCVVSLHTRLGPWPHLLDKNAPLPGVSLPSPFLSLGQVEALRSGEYPHADELHLAELALRLRAGEDAGAGAR